jgi:hypothetical protein
MASGRGHSILAVFIQSAGRPLRPQPLNQEVQIVVAGHRMKVAEHDYERLTRFGRDAAAPVKIDTVA